jgi:hypothetical protein
MICGVFILSYWFHNRWWSSGTHLACFLDHRRQVNCNGGLLPFWLVIFITYTITFKAYYTIKNWTLWLFIHLIIILINSLSMLIIIVEHLLCGSSIFLEEVKLHCFYCNMSCALHHSFCIGSYVVYLRSRPYWYSILDATPYLVGYAGRRHIVFTFICI